MKYGLVGLFLISVSACVSQIPEECVVEKNSRVYDVAIQDTVVVYFKKNNGTGNVKVRNKYGQTYFLDCGEYEKVEQ